MRGLLVQLVSRAYENCLFVRRIFRADKACIGSQAALFIGIAYLVGPIDLIPGNVPIFGHADEFAFLVGGFLVSRRLAPRAVIPALAEPVVVPNFFIVGAARCGTTSLFEALGHHPDVFCCPVKEPNHFATELAERPQVVASARRRGVLLAPGMASLAVLPRVAITPGYDTYLALFSGWTGQRAVGEASTSYLLSPRAASEIARRRPDGRIIVVLRNPVQRARSEAQMHAQLGREAGGGTDGMAASRYAPQVRRFLEAFPREQILFVLFESMLADPAGTLDRVFRHIGVDPEAAPGLTLSHQNQSRHVRFATLNRMLFRSGLRDVLLHIMPAPVRRNLARRYYATGTARTAAESGMSIDVFRDDIEETGRLIGQDLSHWLGRQPPEGVK